MFRSYLASIRLAFGLALIGVGIILLCRWLGVVPDARQYEASARLKRYESFAVASSALIRLDQWPQLQATLQAAVARDAELLSIGVRDDRGRLRADSGGHAEFWQSQPEDQPIDSIRVPISLRHRPWGQIEFCNVSTTVQGWQSVTSDSAYQLATYFAGIGFIAYFVLMARVLRVFYTAQVVPDRVRQALDTLTEGLLLLDEHDRIVLANHAFCLAVGKPHAELKGKRAQSLDWVHQPSSGEISLPWQRITGAVETRIDEIWRYRVTDQRECIFSINATTIQATNGRRRGSLVTLRDVTHIETHRTELESMLQALRQSQDEISEKNRELEILATQDPLTGCLNRRAFFEHFTVSMQFAIESSLPLSCVMVDNDHFKSVNDTYGHHVGDQVLQLVGGMLNRLDAGSFRVCRYGGEEFCVLLPGYPLWRAVEIAEQIRVSLMAIRLEEPSELRLTASLGVSEISLGAKNPQELINQADKCLYIAKQQGRNRVIAYDGQTDTAELAPQGKASVRAERARGLRQSTEKVKGAKATPPYNVVTAFLCALSFRDRETAAHSKRVAELCVHTAKGLVSDWQLCILEMAALLHDLGKVGIPDCILLKPSSLTADEWQLMQRHDEFSAEIVDKAFRCTELTEVVRHHHRSYQQSLQGSDCGTSNLLSRILSIADSYDAMTHDRVYQKGKSQSDAFAELRRCSGTQFDPYWVEQFITRMQPAGTNSVTELAVGENLAGIERLVHSIIDGPSAAPAGESEAEAGGTDVRGPVRDEAISG